MNDKQQVITAVVFLNNEKQEVFVAKRSDSLKMFPGLYELPGGHIEFGESVEDGLKREMREEFGFEVILDRPFYVFTYLANERNTHVVEIVYLARLEDKNVPVNLSEEHSGFAWVKKSEIENYLKNNLEELKAAQEGFNQIEKEL